MNKWFPCFSPLSQSICRRVLRSAAMLALFAGLVVMPQSVRSQQPLTPVAKEVNRKMVKLFGAGGFKGLPSYGTGILISPNGHILTANNHILNTVDLRVHLYDGRFYHAKVLAKEPSLDIALCKIEEKVTDLPYFKFAQEAARKPASVGTWVLALSNCFQVATRDEPMSVQHGTIAAYTELHGRRGVFSAPYQGKVYFLDAVVCNPGSAGGALANRKGELLGLLGRELKNRLSDTWINYAVPIQATTEIIRKNKAGKEMTVKVTMADFVRDAMAGKYIRGKRKELAKKGGGYHGIVLVPNVVAVTPPFVDAIEKDSPAAKAGLQQDDLIVYVDGELVQSIKDFNRLMETYGPNEQMRIDVQRGGRLETVTLKLAPLRKANTP